MARITCGVYFSNLNHLQALHPRISFGKIDYFFIGGELDFFDSSLMC